MKLDRKIVWSLARGWLAAVLVVVGFAVASAPAGTAQLQPLEIVTKNGVQVFSVEMATTDEEKQTGLMYRKELADGKGMLDFNPEQEVSMWMKNTYVSLDMISFVPTGTSAHRRIQPLLSRMSWRSPAIWCCAGDADNPSGDRVGHPLFGSRSVRKSSQGARLAV